MWGITVDIRFFVALHHSISILFHSFTPRMENIPCVSVENQLCTHTNRQFFQRQLNTSHTSQHNTGIPVHHMCRAFWDSFLWYTVALKLLFDGVVRRNVGAACCLLTCRKTTTYLLRNSMEMLANNMQRLNITCFNAAIAPAPPHKHKHRLRNRYS